MKNLIFLFLIALFSNNISSDTIIIEHNDKTHDITNKEDLNQFVSEFLDADFDLLKILSSKVKYNEDSQFHLVDITGYDSNFMVKKVAIPLLKNEDVKSNTFSTLGCSHHCDFQNDDLLKNNYDWLISSPCKSQSCGNVYRCYVIFY